MDNRTLYSAKSDPMTIREFMGFIQQLTQENPEFLDAGIYADCDNVMHRIIACMNTQDQYKSSGRKHFEVVLMDEMAEEQETEGIANCDERQMKERAEYT